MLISTRGRYALRILVDMAEHQTDGYITLKEVAQRQDISEKYLEAIVKDLVKNNILNGVRGKGGGYRLCRSPEQINVGEILHCRSMSVKSSIALREVLLLLPVWKTAALPVPARPSAGRWSSGAGWMTLSAAIRTAIPSPILCGGVRAVMIILFDM